MAFDRSYSADLTIGDHNLIINYSADEDGLEIDTVYSVIKTPEGLLKVRDHIAEHKYQEAIWVAVQKDYKDMCDPEAFQ